MIKQLELLPKHIEKELQHELQGITTLQTQSQDTIAFNILTEHSQSFRQVVAWGS